jgi:T5SS/PEP-CTERM-associated repeat protein
MRNPESSQLSPISFRNCPHISAIIFAVSLGCSLFLSGIAQAADLTWTNGNAGWDAAVNWSPNAVPGGGDRAIFNDNAAIAGYAIGLTISNDVVGNVLFNATTKGMFWKNSTNILTVLNNFILDETSGATAIDTLRTGTIVVTNTSGNAVFNVGSYTDGGKGLLTMAHQNLAGDTTITNYPFLLANSFLVTSNSTFLFNAGTLTTFGGSIDAGATLTFTAFAAVANDIATWNVLGGTNAITYAGVGAASGATELAFTAGGTVNINIISTNTLLTVGGGQLDIGWNGFVNMIVSNGGQLANSGTLYLSRNGASCSNNTLTVTGPGSLVTVSNEMFVGNAAKNNRVTISAGGVISSATGRMGEGAGSSNNVVVITGAGSQWKTANFLGIGDSGLGNTMIISNGGQMINLGTFTRLGLNATSVGNSLFVDGAGSQLSATNAVFIVGNSGTLQSVTVKNAGQIMSLGVNVGAGVGSSNNTILVTGTNSSWIANGLLTIGTGDQGNQVIVTNAGLFAAGNIDVTPSNKAGAFVTVAGGTLLATNSVSGAVLRVGGFNLLGTVTLNGGTITIDQLMLTNGAASVFNFNAGVLNVKTSMVANGSAFVVGDGVDSATLNLLAFSHTYGNGLSISSNATLTGVGTIVGNTTLANGATLAPGSGVGTLTAGNNLILNNGAVLEYDLGTSSDLTVVGGNLTLGGTLNINDAGGFGVGTYTLFTYAGGLTYNGVTIGATPNASLYYAIDTGTVGQVNLDVAYTAPAGPISGSSPVNDGDSGVSYSISSVANATNYTWTVPAGATIASGQGTTSITVNFGCSAVSGNITVTPSNGSGSGTSSSLPVTVNGVGAAGGISGNAAVCAGASGVTYSIGSVSGATTYTWSVPGDATITGGQGSTSITVTWGSTSGNVSVTPANANGCVGTSSSLPVTVNASPTAFNVTGGGAYCSGGSGVVVGLDGSQSGVNYQLQVNGSPTGSPVAGNGSAISFSSQSATGTYTVVAANATTGCTSSMSGSTTVTVNPNPTVFNVTGGGTYCSGGGGATVGLDGSQSGVNYQLQLNNVNTGSPVAGTGGALSFVNQTGVGTYTVVATDGTTGCTTNMNGSAAVTLTDPFVCWQLQYFGCTNCPQADAAADPDGDGQNNLAEFLAGTVPTNSASVLRITSAVTSGANVTLTWSTAGGHTNIVQVTTGAPDGSYSTNGFVDIAGSLTIVGGSGDTSANYVDAGGATNTPARYYRVRLVP